jgi:hypothetical protein
MVFTSGMCGGDGVSIASKNSMLGPFELHNQNETLACLHGGLAIGVDNLATECPEQP